MNFASTCTTSSRRDATPVRRTADHTNAVHCSHALTVPRPFDNGAVPRIGVNGRIPAAARTSTIAGRISAYRRASVQFFQRSPALRLSTGAFHIIPARQGSVRAASMYHIFTRNLIAALTEKSTGNRPKIALITTLLAATGFR